MTHSPALPTSARTPLATTIGVSGFVAFAIGLMILLWPGRTAMVVGALVAAYAIIAGSVYFSLGAFGSSRHGWRRVATIALGIVFLAAGVLTLLNLTQATEWLAVFLGILLGLLTIVEGVAILATIGDSPSKGFSVVYAILSIVAGVVLLFAPVWGVLVLWWILAATLVVLGVINMVRAWRMGHRRG